MNIFDDLIFLATHPAAAIQVITLSGLMMTGFRSLWKKATSKQDKDIDEVIKRIDDLDERGRNQANHVNKMFLRLQIQSGIQHGDLSTSEVLALYDEYVQLGGNSYISRMVSDYVDGKHDK